MSFEAHCSGSVSTALTALFDIAHPIISAPMAAVAGGRLAAAVSTAGGLGLIGGGYGDRAWLQREFALADGARVGCGFITWALHEQPDLLALALEHRPVAVMLSFGDPAPFAEPIHAAGSRLICQVQNRAQAEQALRAGADVLIAQGSEAGGHGFGARGTITLVPEIVDLVADHGAATPVLAAGGIADGRGLAAALMLGAAGVLCGTRLCTATEALTTDAARTIITTADGDQTCRTTGYDLVRGYHWPPGHTMSVLRNAFTDRWDGAEAELRTAGPPVVDAYRRAVAAGDYRVANVTAGQAVGLIHHVEPAGAIVADIAGAAAALLAGCQR